MHRSGGSDLTIGRVPTVTGDRGAPRSTLTAIALLSAAVLLFEIDLVRIFSFTIWHHFTSMVLSIALLGFGASGTILQMFPAVAGSPRRVAAHCALLFVLAAPLAVLVASRLRFDPTRLSQDPSQIVLLAGLYVTFLVPFTLGGLGIILLLKAYPTAAGRLYGADLFAAGMAALSISALLNALGAQGVVLIASALAGGAGVALSFERFSIRTSGWRLVAPIVPLLALPWSASLLPIEPGPGKGLRDWIDPALFPTARLVDTQWNAISRVDVVEGSGLSTWTVNPARPLPVPAQVQVIIDGDAATPIVRARGTPADLEFLDAMVSTAAYQAFRPRRVLVIGAGGGVDVIGALRNGSEYVDAVEVNPIIAELTRGRYSAFAGDLFRRPGTTLHIAEGRSFVARQEGRYDLIQLSLIDTWAASAAGAYSLAESYLYTVEAFEDYLRHLDDGGTLTITRWLWEPPRETLRLCSLALAALRRLGVEHPERHVVVLGSGPLGNLLVRRSAFTQDELSKLAGIAKVNGFRFVYAPVPTTADNAFSRLFASPDAFMASYPYDVTPTTDDSPFFFQFGRWHDVNPLGSGWRENPLVLSGRLVLLTALTQAALLSLVVLVLPVVARRRGASDSKSVRAARPVAYFLLIGLSFMLLEIALMQRFTLYLGNPLYALAAVLAAILIAAGLGSSAANRLSAGPRSTALPFVAIIALTVLYAWALPMIFRATIGLGMPSRLVIVLLLLFPLGFVMGVPFPAALSRCGRAGEGADLFGWAWAANGCGSVIGPIVGALLAIEIGFAAVMMVAAAGYALAFLIFAPMWRDAR